MILTKLVLSCPRAMADAVVEFLLDSEWDTNGFTTVDAAGHGADFAHASLREKVRGSIDTVLVILILPGANVPPLLEQLRGQFRSAQMQYWTEPVHEAGDFS
jgi:hypothetical protein